LVRGFFARKSIYLANSTAIRPKARSTSYLERLKGELSKLEPIIGLEVVCEPQGSRTEGGLTVGTRTIEHDPVFRGLRRAGPILCGLCCACGGR
jgi:hypothetical protein